MPGNSQRKGAVRTGASRKGPLVGSGGQKSRALKGKGPTPKAEDRDKHSAAKRRRAIERREDALTKGRSGTARPARRTTGAPRPRPKSAKASSEMVAGRNSVVEALRAGVPVTTMYVAGRIDVDDRVRESLKLALARGVAVLETPRGELDRLTDGAVHQGLALQVPAYEYKQLDELLAATVDSGQPALLVALDGVTDPRNLGAVVRSVGAFGGHGVVVPERRAAGMTASAWKSSAGAAARVPVARVTNLTRGLEELKRAGCFVVGLDMGGSVALPDLTVARDPMVLVVGSEGKGLSRLVRETCDLIVSIPMHAATESLNAGIAAGVALYEVARQRANG